MTELTDIEYYREREAQERTIADSATNPAVKALHLELAARYAAFLADQAGSGSSATGLDFASDGLPAPADKAWRNTELKRHS